MITPLIIASSFILIGVVLVRSACKSISAGAAEPDEGDTIFRKKQTILFSVFVITQIVFGCISILAGVGLAVATAYGLPK